MAGDDLLAAGIEVRWPEGKTFEEADVAGEAVIGFVADEWPFPDEDPPDPL